MFLSLAEIERREKEENLKKTVLKLRKVIRETREDPRKALIHKRTKSALQRVLKKKKEFEGE